MKKLYCIVLCLIIMLSACSMQKQSGITIDDLMSGALLSIDAKGTISKSTVENGVKFEFSTEKYNISGSADKKENLTHISFASTESSNGIEYIMKVSLEKFIADMTDSMNTPMGNLNAIVSLSKYCNIFRCVSPFRENAKTVLAGSVMEGLDVLLISRETPVTINGWKYSVQADKDKKELTIMADYIGEEDSTWEKMFY